MSIPSKEVRTDNIYEIPSVALSSPADRLIRERLASQYMKNWGVDETLLPDCFKINPADLIESPKRAQIGTEILKQVPVVEVSEVILEPQSYSLITRAKSLLRKLKRS